MLHSPTNLQNMAVTDPITPNASLH